MQLQRRDRDRVWQAVSEDRLVIGMGKLEEAPGGKAAARVFRAQKSACAHQQLDAVLTAWASRTRGRDASRRTYLLFSMLQPYPDPPTG